MNHRSNAMLFMSGLLIAFLMASCGGGSSPDNSAGSASATLLPTIAPLPTVPLLATVPRLPTVPPQPTVARQPTVASQATNTPNLPDNTPTEALATETSAPAGGQILFQDDFTDPSSGWVVAKTDYGEFAYDNGAYRYSVTKPNFITHSVLPDKSFDNISIEVDATLDQGAADTVYGLICRATANASQLQSGYKFLVLPNGGYGILEQTGVNASDIKLLTQDQDPSAIHAQGTNHLQAVCSGSHLALYVNGKELADADNGDLQSGQVGLAVSSPQGSGNVQVLFDNFMVKRAAP